MADFSEVTMKYLEDWPDLEFGVHTPNLKESVLRQIIFRDYRFVKELHNSVSTLYFLSKKNMTFDDLLNDLQSYIQEVAQNTEVFRATEQSILTRHILREDERWKSQFETHNSGGSLTPSGRSDFEHRFFGFPNFDLPETKDVAEDNPYHVSKRPIYGYFSPDKNGILNNEGTQPPPNVTAQYGRIHCRIKPEKRSDITISMGDSLGGEYALSPINKPHYTSCALSLYSLNFTNMSLAMRAYQNMYDFSEDGQKTIKPVNAKNLYSVVNSNSSYTEVQFHDGLSMSDVESLHFSEGNFDSYSSHNLDELREAVENYNDRHPDTPVKLVTY